jgi:hypothetical protein
LTTSHSINLVKNIFVFAKYLTWSGSKEEKSVNPFVDPSELLKVNIGVKTKGWLFSFPTIKKVFGIP